MRKIIVLMVALACAANLPAASFTIKTDPPGAKVFVDGSKWPSGVTPLLLKDVRMGSVNIRLRKPGYEVWSDSIYVNENMEGKELKCIKLQKDLAWDPSDEVEENLRDPSLKSEQIRKNLQSLLRKEFDEKGAKWTAKAMLNCYTQWEGREFEIRKLNEKYFNRGGVWIGGGVRYIENVVPNYRYYYERVKEYLGYLFAEVLWEKFKIQHPKPKKNEEEIEMLKGLLNMFERFSSGFLNEYALACFEGGLEVNKYINKVYENDYESRLMNNVSRYNELIKDETQRKRIVFLDEKPSITSQPIYEIANLLYESLLEEDVKRQELYVAKAKAYVARREALLKGNMHIAPAKTIFDNRPTPVRQGKLQVDKEEDVGSVGLSATDRQAVANTNDYFFLEFQSDKHPLKGGPVDFFGQKASAGLGVYSSEMTADGCTRYIIEGKQAQKYLAAANKIDVDVTPGGRYYRFKVYIPVPADGGRKVFDGVANNIIKRQGEKSSNGIFDFKKFQKDRMCYAFDYGDGALCRVSINPMGTMITQEYVASQELLKRDGKAIVESPKENMSFKTFKIFGQMLGAEIVDANIQRDKDDSRLATYNPDKKFLTFSEYKLRYTPISKRIWKISATASFKNNQETDFENTIAQTISLLSLKFGVSPNLKKNQDKPVQLTAGQFGFNTGLLTEECEFVLEEGRVIIYVTAGSILCDTPELFENAHLKFVIIDAYDKELKEILDKEEHALAKEQIEIYKRMNANQLDAL